MPWGRGDKYLSKYNLMKSQTSNHKPAGKISVNSRPIKNELLKGLRKAQSTHKKNRPETFHREPSADGHMNQVRMQKS